MAKRGYKQGAMSATDAVHQLQAASGKCDFKWMKAHAASARFFGAREAEVKKALSKCPRGVRGTPEQHATTAREYLASAEALLAQSRTASGATRESMLIRARDNALAAQAECSWTRNTPTCRTVSAVLNDVLTEGSPGGSRGRGRLAGPRRRGAKMAARRSAAELRQRVRTDPRAGVPELVDLGGVRGTPEEHAASAISYAAAAMRAIERAKKMQGAQRRRQLALAKQQIDAGQTECTWVPGRGYEPEACRKVREAEEALFFAKGGARGTEGLGRGGCVYVVEKRGKKRKVKSDLASAKSAAKRMAGTGEAKITRACSKGRGSDSGAVVARCTKSSCK